MSEASSGPFGPRGRGGDEPVFVRRSASPLRHGQGVRGGDAGGYRRDDKGRKDGGRDHHGRHRLGDCYGDSRGSEKLRVPQQNIDIILGARVGSELCTLIEARAAEFNHVVTAPNTWPHTPTFAL